MRRKIVFGLAILIVAVLLLSLFFGGWHKKDGVPSEKMPEPKVVIEKIQGIFPQKEFRKDDKTNRLANIYIQGSESMLGFVYSPDTEYSKCIGDLPLTLKNCQISAKCFRFGHKVKEEEVEIEYKDIEKAAYSKKEFYFESFNDMSGLLGRIYDEIRERQETPPIKTPTNESEADLSTVTDESPAKFSDSPLPETKSKRQLPDTFIVISAGVNNFPDGNKEIKLIDSLRDLIKTGYFLDVIGIKSGFNGPVWSIQRSHGNKKMILDKYYEGERPFYFFIISKDRDLGRKLFRSLKEKYGNITAHHLQIPGPGRSIELESLKIKSGKVSSASLRKDYLEKGFVYLNCSGLSKEDKEALVALSPLDNPESDLKKIIYQEVDLSTGESKETERIQVEKPPEGTNGIYLTIQRKPDKGWKYACKVRILPDCPKWIDDYSIDTDIKVENFEKTYKIKDVIRSLFNDPYIQHFDDFHFYVVLKG